jgi:hypothetical protein
VIVAGAGDGTLTPPPTYFFLRLICLKAQGQGYADCNRKTKFDAQLALSGTFPVAFQYTDPTAGQGVTASTQSGMVNCTGSSNTRSCDFGTSTVSVTSVALAISSYNRCEYNNTTTPTSCKTTVAPTPRTSSCAASW